MFEVVVLAIGTLITLVLACMKYAEAISFGWLGVFIPLLVSIVIVAAKNGGDLSDVIPD